MQNISIQIKNYAENHKHPINEIIHIFAIPTIMFSIIGFLTAMDYFVAIIFITLSLIFYSKLSMKAFYLMTVWSMINLLLVYFLFENILLISFVTFIVGWTIQFIGHFIEGKRPSFFEDIKYLMIGPLFVFDCLLSRFGWKW